MFKELALAFGFLTIIPMPHVSYGANELGRAGKWFPFVGLVLGGILVGVYIPFMMVFPPFLAGALTVVAWVMLTGGLHLDGLADCFDGMSAAVSVERRLEIMRDPRMGAFGGIGLTLFLILKVTAAGFLHDQIFALLFAPIVARFTLLIVARLRPARPGGLGAWFASEIGIGSLIVASIIPLAMIPFGFFGLNCRIWMSCAALTAAVVMTLHVIMIARSRLGGMTGDVLGLTVELSELAVLLVFASTFRI